MIALAATLAFLTPLDLIASKYGVRVVVLQKTLKWHGDDYYVTADPPTADDMATYVPKFAREWNRYPADVALKFKVKRIVFGVNLAVDGQFRAGVPAFDGDTMYYDPRLGNYAPRYQEAVIHHEFFHMIDQRRGSIYKDPDWAALNPATFKYGSGGAKMREAGVGDLVSNLRGFITLYGTAAIEEDKAELFGHLMVDPDFVFSRAKADQILDRKVKKLQGRLRALGLVNLIRLKR